MRVYTRTCAHIDIRIYAKYTRIICVCIVWIYLSCTVHVPDNYKLVSFDVKSPVFHFNWHYSNSVPRLLYHNLPLNYHYQHGLSEPLPYINFLSVQHYTTNMCMEQPWGHCCCRRNCDATCGRKRPWNLLTNDTALVALHWWHLYCRSQRRNWRFS